MDSVCTEEERKYLHTMVCCLGAGTSLAPHSDPCHLCVQADSDATLHSKLQDIKVRLHRVYTHMSASPTVVSPELFEVMKKKLPGLSYHDNQSMLPSPAPRKADASQTITSALQEIDTISKQTRRAAVAASVRSAARDTDRAAFFKAHPSAPVAKDDACAQFWQQSTMCAESLPTTHEQECTDIWEEAQTCFLLHPALRK